MIIDFGSPRSVSASGTSINLQKNGLDMPLEQFRSCSRPFAPPKVSKSPIRRDQEVGGDRNDGQVRATDSVRLVDVEFAIPPQQRHVNRVAHQTEPDDTDQDLAVTLRRDRR